MAGGEEAIDLPTGVFLILRDLIRDRIGISFEDDHRELLALKLSDRVRGLGLRSFLDYFYALKYDTGSAAEWDRLTDALSVQETYFWREIDQVRALVDVLVPRHAADRPVRVWSAACATGEEPLTIAMALAEAGWFGRADVEVWASDTSPAALERAERGVYRERSFRALPADLREKYFTPAGDGWRVDPALRARVRYSRANLLDPAETRHLATAPFVFCRNVFIYFSTQTVSRVVRQFAERMPRPGYLFVGVSESLVRAKTAFELEEVGGAFVYAKRPDRPGNP
ncbi:MAG TPA: protein-glutamate O-methyltransferase CheR [Gemmataceae bacterium]|nr:protein-glutamate O-methyltransferase CheR [Gemmataceae bacterium]